MSFDLNAGNYPEDLVKILQSPNADKVLGAYALGFRQKKFVLLITDLRGFTRVFERNQVPELVTKFNIRLFERSMHHIQDQYGGCVNKLLGDGIFAYLPNSGTSTKKQAFKLAKDLIRTFKRESDSDQWEDAQGIKESRVTIMLYAGKGYIGAMGGISSYSDYTLIGADVNRAFGCLKKIPGSSNMIGFNDEMASEVPKEFRGKIQSKLVTMKRTETKVRLNYVKFDS